VRGGRSRAHQLSQPKRRMFAHDGFVGGTTDALIASGVLCRQSTCCDLYSKMSAGRRRRRADQGCVKDGDAFHPSETPMRGRGRCQWFFHSGTPRCRRKEMRRVFARAGNLQVRTVLEPQWRVAPAPKVSQGLRAARALDSRRSSRRSFTRRGLLWTYRETSLESTVSMLFWRGSQPERARTELRKLA
jgi:hypothetical protein